MNKNQAAEELLGKITTKKKKQGAKKSLDNYINQLKIHFDLDDNEIVKILDSIIKSRKNDVFFKKWWQIWR